MSLSREDTVVCPGCGTPGPVTLYTSIDVTADPSLKERLLKGQLSTFVCPKCGRPSRIAHTLLYADTARDFFVQLDPESTMDVVAAVARLGTDRPRVSRIVRDGNALIEKVRIDDASLDDRVVEVWKVLLAMSHQEYLGFPWYFERAEGTGERAMLLFTIVTAKGPLATRRPRAEYAALAGDLESRGALVATGPYARIDRDFAHLWLARPT